MKLKDVLRGPRGYDQDRLESELKQSGLDPNISQEDFYVYLLQKLRKFRSELDRTPLLSDDILQRYKKDD
jgi:hypothetical protein